MSGLNAIAASVSSTELSPYEHLVQTGALIVQERHCRDISIGRPCSLHQKWKDAVEDCLSGASALVIEVNASPPTPRDGLATPGLADNTVGTVSCGAPLRDDDKLDLSRMQRASSPVSSASRQVLLERWTLELSRCPSDSNERVVTMPRLLEALKSTLLFSQFQSWLKLTEGKWDACIRYNLLKLTDCKPPFAFPTGSSLKNPVVTLFPVAHVGDLARLSVRCTTLPYVSEIPFISPELACAVRNRRAAACSQSSLTSAAPDAEGSLARSTKRRNRLSKESEKKQNCGSVSPDSDESAALDPCVHCGAAPRIHKAAGERKRKAPNNAHNGRTSLSAVASASLSPPAMPLRVRSPPRPIMPVMGSHSPVPTRMDYSNLPQTNLSTAATSDSAFTATAMIKQSSAPAQTVASASSPLSSSYSGSESPLQASSLCSSSLLRNHSLKTITVRRLSQPDNVAAGSPHPSMLPSHRVPPFQRRTSCPGPLSSSPLLGSFEESMLGGRLAATDLLEGYSLQLRCICSCSISSPSVTLPLRTEFYNTASGAPSPYLGVASSPSPPFRVSRQGSLQAVLFRPNGTVQRVFMVPYDLSHLERSKTTFIRQRTFFAALGSSSKTSLRYTIHFSLECTSTSQLLLHKGIRVVFSPLPPNAYNISLAPCELVTETLGPHIVTLSSVQLSDQSEYQITDADAAYPAAAPLPVARASFTNAPASSNPIELKKRRAAEAAASSSRPQASSPFVSLS